MSAPSVSSLVVDTPVSGGDGECEPCAAMHGGAPEDMSPYGDTEAEGDSLLGSPLVIGIIIVCVLLLAGLFFYMWEEDDGFHGGKATHVLDPHARAPEIPTWVTRTSCAK